MSRPLRIEYPGAWYHVMNRGAARAEIFDTGNDRQRFLALLSDMAQRFAIETHCYCLMSNHYHLLLHTPREGLARGMRHVNGLYTQYLNRQRGTDGPLFRGRYKSILVEDDVYLLQVSRYIHLNPIHPGLVDNPADYAGSSCHAYTHDPAGFASLETAYLLDMMGGRTVSIQRQQYRQFLAEGVDEATEAFYASQRQSPILGSDTFRDELASGRADDPEIPQLRALRLKSSLAAIQDFVAQYPRARNALSPRQQRDVALYLAQREGYRLREIAVGFDMNHYTSVSSAIRRLDTTESAIAELIDAFLAKEW